MPISREELLKWSMDENQFLVEQDEELILSTLSVVPEMLFVLDSGQALPQKQLILLEALFVMVYDGDHEDEVISALKERQALLQRFVSHIPEYLREVVLPKLGLENSSV